MSATPGVLAAALADRYHIEREIGAGGMATVYLAEDLKHRRKVALKVLRPELGALLGTDRFLAEIEVTANLHHPHLLPLFDSGEANGLLFYVMPYIAGESLRHRLERERQLPIEEAIRIATSVASALDYAHRRGVIHRDLKPENILLHDGQPLISDFGIALAISNAGGARVTQTGLSLGTPQYMSPEQATGDRALDARSDLYSLAAVLYEMLTGDPPHTASTTQALIAKILTERPDSVRAARSATPQHVDDAILCALSKLPADRFASADEFADALLGRRAVPHAESPAAGRQRRTLLTVAAVGLVALLSGAGAASLWMGSAPVQMGQPVTRVFVPTGGELVADRPLAVSPDGRTIAYGMGTGELGGVWLRSVDQLAPRQIAPSGRSPVFSGDSRWLAFLVGDEVWRVPVAGGAPGRVGPSVTLPVSLDWTADGDLIVVRPPGTVLLIDTATSAVDTIFSAASVRWPALLPGGGELLYSAYAGTDSMELRIAELATGEERTLLRPAFQARDLGNGHLLYARPDSALYVVPFDPRRRRVTGAAVRVLDHVRVGAQGATVFDVSRNGIAVHEISGVARMALFRVRASERAFEELRVGHGTIDGVRIAPDGKRIAFSRDHDIHVFDLLLGTSLRLTDDAESTQPVWFPGGDSLGIQYGLGLGRRARVLYAHDAAPSRLVDSINNRGSPQAVLRDGRMLVGRGQNSMNNVDLFVLSHGPDSLTYTPYLHADWSELKPALSPDERWVAYVSAETGSSEVWVRPFADAAAGRWRVSSGGGEDPIWSPDGGTLYWWEGPELRAARVNTARGFELTDRRTVLADPQYAVQCCFANYDVMPDGSIIMARHVAPPTTPGFIMITNWFAEMQSRIRSATADAPQP